MIGAFPPAQSFDFYWNILEVGETKTKLCLSK
jgi:hypothetical protein